MDLTKFYSDSERLKYNPKINISLKRKGIKKLFSYDDRLITLITKLKEVVGDIDNQRRNIRVLNIGVGDAVYESNLQNTSKKKIDFYGVDISKHQLKRARKYLKQAEQVNIDTQKLPYKDNYFDLVIVSELLEHVFFPERAVSEAIRVLKKDGYFFLTYPNSGSLQLRLSLLFTGNSILLNYPKNKEHIRFFSKSGILKLMNGKKSPNPFLLQI